MVAALVENGRRGDEARTSLATAGRLFAPQHLCVEVVHSLRGLVMARKLETASADEAFTEFGSLTLRLFLVAGSTLDRVWPSRRDRNARCASCADGNKSEVHT